MRAEESAPVIPLFQKPHDPGAVDVPSLSGLDAFCFPIPALPRRAMGSCRPFGTIPKREAGSVGRVEGIASHPSAKARKDGAPADGVRREGGPVAANREVCCHAIRERIMACMRWRFRVQCYSVHTNFEPSLRGPVQSGPRFVTEFGNEIIAFGPAFCSPLKGVGFFGLNPQAAASSGLSNQNPT